MKISRKRKNSAKSYFLPYQNHIHVPPLMSSVVRIIEDKQRETQVEEEVISLKRVESLVLQEKGKEVPIKNK